MGGNWKVDLCEIEFRGPGAKAFLRGIAHRRSTLAEDFRAPLSLRVMVGLVVFAASLAYFIPAINVWILGQFPRPAAVQTSRQLVLVDVECPVPPAGTQPVILPRWDGTRWIAGPSDCLIAGARGQYGTRPNR